MKGKIFVKDTLSTYKQTLSPVAIGGSSVLALLATVSQQAKVVSPIMTTMTN